MVKKKYKIKEIEKIQKIKLKINNYEIKKIEKIIRATHYNKFPVKLIIGKRIFELKND